MFNFRFLGSTFWGGEFLFPPSIFGGGSKFEYMFWQFAIFEASEFSILINAGVQLLHGPACGEKSRRSLFCYLCRAVRAAKTFENPNIRCRFDNLPSMWPKESIENNITILLTLNTWRTLNGYGEEHAVNHTYSERP